VSYFSTRRGSIIGAGRLSFRVRNGSGRFPAAVAAVTLFYFQPLCPQRLVGVFLVVGWGVVARISWLRAVLWLTLFLKPVFWFWLCVSFRPVSASSLHLLLGF
jgi:hypothetical protein